MAKDASFASTDNIASTLLEKLNESSMRGFLTSVTDTLNAQSGTDLTAIQNQINLINTHLSEVENEAKILSADELAQVEQALKDVLNNLQANGFLGLLCVDIGGQKFSIKDLVSRLVQADRVKEVENVWDANYENITQMRFKLEDDSIITFTPVVEDLADAKNYTFSADWKGVPASFVINFAKVQRTVNVSGQSVSSYEYLLKKKSNVLFSITSGLGNCVETSIDATVPDLNGDTLIGNVPVVMTLASASGSVEVGSTTNVGFSNAQGTVSATSSDGAVATAIVSGSNVVITGVGAGSAIITVTDGTTSLPFAISVTAVVVVTPMTADKTALSIDVGSSDTVTMSNADGAISAVSSDPAKVSVSVSGNVVTVNAVGATDPDTVNVSISDGDDTVVVTVYTAVSGGGGL